MRSRSRSASICAAVCAPPSVTICSSTRSRASTRSMCWAYWALFSAARSLWELICFSLTRSHILKGAMPIAASGIRTQTHSAGLPIQPPPNRYDANVVFRRQRSSGRTFGRHFLLRDPARCAAQRLDLRRRLCAVVGHDLLQHAHARLELMAARRILSGLLRGHTRFDLELLLAQPEKPVGDNHQQDHRQADDDQRDEDFGRTHHYALPPLSMVRASMSLASFEGWSVAIRSSVSSRSLIDPSSARS